MIEVDDDPAAPELLPKLFARYDFAGLLQKERQHLQRLLLEPEPETFLAEFARTQIELEYAKAHDLRPGRHISHRGLPLITALYPAPRSGSG